MIWRSAGELATKVALSAYARKRVEASFARVPMTLRFCDDLRRGTALDAGCGAAHETLALARNFASVLGADTNLRAIWTARNAARSWRVENVSFEHMDVEVERLSQFDLVWSNVMSHNVASRRRLLANLASAIPAGGWLYYSEECEGYPPMEFSAALERRDAREARARIRQVLNAFAGKGFRFYRAGTAGPLVERLGFEVRHRETRSWRGLVYLDQIWCRRTDLVAADVTWQTGDYLCSDDAPRLDGRNGHAHDAWMPGFRNFAAMASAAGIGRNLSPSVLERLRLRAPRASATVNWVQLEDEFDRFLKEALPTAELRA